MAWSEATILARAKEFVRTYADEERVGLDDVRAAFAQFAIETRAFKGSIQHTTVANQREYRLGRIHHVERVLYDGQRLPRRQVIGVWDMSYHVHTDRLVLNFEPDAGKALIIEGFETPADINSVDLQPEIYWMDVVAYLCAAQVLARYGDPQAVARAQVYQAYYLHALNTLRRMQSQNPLERGAAVQPVRRLSL